jgi:hypothetical protein
MKKIFSSWLDKTLGFFFDDVVEKAVEKNIPPLPDFLFRRVTIGVPKALEHAKDHGIEIGTHVSTINLNLLTHKLESIDDGHALLIPYGEGSPVTVPLEEVFDIKLVVKYAEE